MANYQFNGVSNDNVDYDLTFSSNGIFQEELVGLILGFLETNAASIGAYKHYEVTENISPVV